jgi:hypothetical protein
MTKAGADEVVFTNLAHSPRHASEMGYKLTGSDALSSWVVVIDADGRLGQHSFDFQRVRRS